MTTTTEPQTHTDMAPWVETIVEPTVRDVYRRFAKDGVTLDDLRQEAAVWWYGPGKKYVETYLAEDDKHVRLRRSIWRFVARFAERERAERRGYNPADQHRYNPMTVIALLPVALDPDGIPDGGGVHEGPKAKGNLAEGGDVMAMLLDVRAAVRALNFEDHAFLVLAEDLACDWERVAANTGTLPDSCRRRHTRIAQRLTRWLNNEIED